MVREHHSLHCTVPNISKDNMPLLCYCSKKMVNFIIRWLEVSQDSWAHRIGVLIKKYVCPFCLQCFWREDQQNDHTTYCGLQKPAKIVFPRKPNKSSMDKEERDSGEIETVEDLVGITEADAEFFTSTEADPSIVSFKNFHKTMKTEFVLYVDFECFIKKGQTETDDDEHVPSGFSCLRVAACDEYDNAKVYSYNGADAMDKFFDHIELESQKITKILDTNKPMEPLTRMDEKAFDKAKNCTCCGEVIFYEKNFPKGECGR